MIIVFIGQGQLAYVKKGILSVVLIFSAPYYHSCSLYIFSGTSSKLWDK